MNIERKKIILIEDNPDHADLITEVLGKEDIENDIILLRDGMEAIVFFQKLSIEWQIKNKIRLIVIDLKLAKISGMDILKSLKNNSKYSKIPMIILSVSSDQKTIDEAYKNGANGYFVKPVDYKELVDKIKILKKCC